MVDRAKALGDQPSMEDLNIFHAMVRNEGEKCLTYVHEAARIMYKPIIKEMIYMMIIYIPGFVGKKKVVLLVGGLVLLRKDERLLKWMNQSPKMFTQLVILVSFQGTKLKSLLPGHQV